MATKQESLSENSETKPLSARKSLFKSPNQQKSVPLVNEKATDYVLIGWIQRQTIYIKALEKELTFYRVILNT